MQMASRILLADDSITIQKVVNLTFADEGIEVVAVSNGDIAERRLAEIGPDLVLADIFMPGKNGYELCETIKENPQYCHVPVVLLVGAFEPFDQTEARRVKADAHLTKPFESRTLVETVRRLISASWRSTTGPMPAPMANDSHDEDLDSRLAETPAPMSSLPGNLDLSAMVATTVAPSTPHVRNTGELGSPSPVAQGHVVDSEVVDESASETIPADLTDTRNRFEPMELSQNGDFSSAEVASTFNFDVGSQSTTDLQDFDTTDPIDVSPLQGSTLEALPPHALNDVDLSGAGEGADWFNSATSFDTSARPSDEGTWRAPTNGSSLSYQPSDYSLQTETVYSSSEASTDTSCATLLAVDEPLGDLLFDEAATSTTLPPIEMLTSDPPGLELGEAVAEQQVVEPALASLDLAQSEVEASTQFDLVEITEAPAAERPVVIGDNGGNADEFSVEPVEHVMVSADEGAAPDAQVSQDTFGSIEAPSHDSEPVVHEVSSDLDRTPPLAASYSTTQLDTVAMPTDTVEYLAKQSTDADAQQTDNTEEASFTAPATWTEEEARFTPIDIEAVAVEDAPEQSQTAVDSPAENVETYGAVVTEETGNESTQSALSTAAIETIVRRVVAEMSESVVREVAWEVVPDCVERVIEQLTRESLSKRA